MSKSISPMSLLKPGTKHFTASPRPHRSDEFAASYSSAGCSPAWPASASPAGIHLQAAGSFLSTRFLRGNIYTGLEGSDKAKYQHQGWAKLEYRSGPDRSIELNCQLRRRGTLPRRPAGADFGDRGDGVSNSQPANVQNKRLASPRIQPEHEQWRMGSGWRSRVTFLVARPAIGLLWPGRRIECRSAQGS